MNTLTTNMGAPPMDVPKPLFDTIVPLTVTAPVAPDYAVPAPRLLSEAAWAALEFAWRAPKGVSMNQARMVMAVKFGAHVEAELESILGEKTNK